LVHVLGNGGGPEAIASIAGLGHKVDGGLKLNAPREPLDSAEIGRPARHLLSLEFYEDAHNVLAARGGCPYRCPFCSASYLWGGRRRMRPVEDLLAEVDDVIRDYGAEHVFFVDDILTLNRGWLDELMDAIEARGGGFTWGCATRVDRVDDELLRRMAETGCTAIQFGIESGAQEILDSVKGIRKEDALEAVESAVGAGIAVSCSFMIPFPDDTEETLAQSAAFMGDIRAAGGKLLVSYTTPFPGTMFYERAEELGLTILTRDWSLYDCKHMVMETKNFSAERIEALAAGIANSLGLSQTE
jgi:anaerobic magnesium-protoporphyrin IX monomethyl ester cyclase